MMKIPSTFQLSLAIKDHTSCKSVVFKNDGQRFEGGREKTIKFHTDSVYEVELWTKPGLEITSLSLTGPDVGLEQTSKDNKYAGIWKTDGMEPQGTGQREKLNARITGVFGSCTVPLQAKFYKQGNSKGALGTEVKSITWKCVIKNDGTIIVTDETFL